MAKKILSVLLAVMMVAALCTVAFVSSSAADLVKVTFNGKEGLVKNQDTFAVQMVMNMPETIAVAGGQFDIAYDDSQVELVSYGKNDDGEDVYYRSDCTYSQNIIVSKITPEQTNYLMGYQEFKANNSLNGDKSVFAEFTFKVKSTASPITITLNKDKLDMNLFITGVNDPQPYLGHEEEDQFAGVTLSYELSVPTYTVADMTEIQKVIDAAQAIIDDAKNPVDTTYTAETVAALRAALTAAKTVAETDPYDITQSAVDAAKDALQAAINGLKNIVDTNEELQAVIDSYKDLNAADYDADSFAALQEAIKAAQALIDSGKATADEIIAANAAIEKAAAALKAPAQDPAKDPSQDPNKGDDNKGDGNKGDGNKGDGNKGDGNKDVPTGEGSVAFALLAVLAMAGAAVVVARKRATK